MQTADKPAEAELSSRMSLACCRARALLMACIVHIATQLMLHCCLHRTIELSMDERLLAAAGVSLHPAAH